MKSMKPELFIDVKGARHFLNWELPQFKKHFTIVHEQSKEAIYLAFGPDAFQQSSNLQAKRKIAYLFPGFGFNPIHNSETKNWALEKIINEYDAILINQGPLEIAFATIKKKFICPFSLNTSLISMTKPRTDVKKLLHVSADYPQKDWKRSEEIMMLTGLQYEVFPSRKKTKTKNSLKKRCFQVFNRCLRKIRIPYQIYLLPDSYVSHHETIKKYNAYDGFVHIASECKDPLHIDGKYTACLLEAGLTGAILFWHDTFKLGNNLETVFSCSERPEIASKQILDIIKSIDIKRHSKETREEIYDKFNCANSVDIRANIIKGLL